MNYNVLDNFLRTILGELYYIAIILIVGRLVYLICTDFRDRSDRK